jgi:hypothetical protein
MLRTEISEIIASSRIRGFKLVQGAHRPGCTERRTAHHIFTLDVRLLPGTSQLRQLISTVRADAGSPDYSPAASSKHSIAATRVHLLSKHSSTQTLSHWFAHRPIYREAKPSFGGSALHLFTHLHRRLLPDSGIRWFTERPGPSKADALRPLFAVLAIHPTNRLLNRRIGILPIRGFARSPIL